MKLFKYFIFCGLFMLTSCKRTTIDGTSLKSFQTSANDMASRLSTLKQIKFNEALFIIKTYGTNAQGDVEQMNTAAKLLSGKNVQQIFAMADQIAKEKNIEWSSTAPPSLGEMNIFGNEAATEIDANDIPATTIAITVTPIRTDSLQVPQALLITPRLLDENGDILKFTNATLETTMEIFSSGVKLLTSRNFMTNNNFKGFNLNLNSLPADKVLNGMIDAKITVKTAKKTLTFTKTNIAVNASALKQELPKTDESIPQDSLQVGTPEIPTATSPKLAVTKFIGYLNTHNLKAAYQLAHNPNWGTFESFSNPTSGFGSIQSITSEAVNTTTETANEATVTATYQVKNKEGKEVKLNTTYRLKNNEGIWQIVGYQINSSN